MWNTSQGNRILQGAEAILFKAGVMALVEQIKEEVHFAKGDYSVVAFDELTWSQRLAVLETITTHLLSATAPPPELSAVNESAVAMVFDRISYEIDREIEGEPLGNSWRRLVLSAAHECLCEPNDDRENAETNNYDVDSVDDDIPESAESNRRDLWHPLVQSLADCILWDRDFEMIEDFVDEPPEKAAMIRQIMGIDDNYFSTAADDLHSPDAISDSLNRLSKLLVNTRLQ